MITEDQIFRIETRTMNKLVGDRSPRNLRDVVVNEAALEAFRDEMGYFPSESPNTVDAYSAIRVVIDRVNRMKPVEKSGRARKNPATPADTTDPSREEMIAAIRDYYGPNADESDIEEAIWWFANNWHGGQGSQLYSVLSTSEFSPGRNARGPASESAEDIYSMLENRFVRYTGMENPRRKSTGDRKISNYQKWRKEMVRLGATHIVDQPSTNSISAWKRGTSFDGSRDYLGEWYNDHGFGKVFAGQGDSPAGELWQSEGGRWFAATRKGSFPVTVLQGQPSARFNPVDGWRAEKGDLVEVIEGHYAGRKGIVVGFGRGATGRIVRIRTSDGPRSRLIEVHEWSVNAHPDNRRSNPRLASGARIASRTDINSRAASMS